MGWNVAVTDLDPERADSTLSGLSAHAADHFSMALDITRQDHWQLLEEAVTDRWGGLGILVNNAGVAAAGNIEETSMEDWAWIIDIDLMGVVRGCHQFAGIMKRQKSGHIVNISSFAGLAGLPYVSAYGTAKAGVIALSEALYAEMRPHGVGVTVACPAFVKTGLLETFRSTRPGTKDKVAGWMESSGITAQQVAAQIADAVNENRFLLLTHAATRNYWRFKRWLPNRYLKMMARRSRG
jgi:NAD(P)-dependent dehydrogenase (short-subunit alcohol dehydrogenase family)